MAPRTCFPVTFRRKKPNNGCFDIFDIVPVFGLEVLVQGFNFKCKESLTLRI
jgi:hypothetical protein